MFLLKELQLSLLNLLNYLMRILKILQIDFFLEIWPIESFISVDILPLNTFVNFFCLDINNISWSRSSLSNIFKLILKVVPLLFLTLVFSLLSCVSAIFTFDLLYSNLYTNYKTYIFSINRLLLLLFFKNMVNYQYCICNCCFYFISKNDLLNFLKRLKLFVCFNQL